MPWGPQTAPNYGFAANTDGWSRYPIGNGVMTWDGSTGATANGSLKLDATYVSGGVQNVSIYPSGTVGDYAPFVASSNWRGTAKVKLTTAMANVTIQVQCRLYDSSYTYLGSLFVVSAVVTSGGAFQRIEGNITSASILSAKPTTAFVQTEIYTLAPTATSGTASIWFDEISGQFGDPSQPATPQEPVFGSDEWINELPCSSSNAGGGWSGWAGGNTVTATTITTDAPPGADRCVEMSSTITAGSISIGFYSGTGASKGWPYSVGQRYHLKIWVKVMSYDGTGLMGLSYGTRYTTTAGGYIGETNASAGVNAVIGQWVEVTANNLTASGAFPTAQTIAAQLYINMSGSSTITARMCMQLVAAPTPPPQYFDGSTMPSTRWLGTAYQSKSAMPTIARSSFIGTRPLQEKAGAADEHDQQIADPQSITGNLWGGYQPTTPLTQSNVAASIPGTPITSARRYVGTASGGTYLATAQQGDPASGTVAPSALASFGYKPVIAGQPYTFSYWVKNDVGLSTAGAQLYFRDVNGTWIGSTFVGPAEQLPVGRWVYVSKSFIAPAGSAWAMGWASLNQTNGQPVDFQMTGVVDAVGSSAPSFYVGTGFRASRQTSRMRTILSGATNGVDVASRQVNRFRTYYDSLFADDGKINLNPNPLPISSSFYSIGGSGEIVQSGYDPTSPVNQYSIEHRPLTTGTTDSFLRAGYTDWKPYFGSGDYIDVGCYVWANTDAFSQFTGHPRSGAIVAFSAGGTVGYVENRGGRNTVANTWEFVTLRFQASLTATGSISEGILIRLYNLDANAGGDPRVKHAGITIRRVNAGDPAMTAADLVYPSLPGHVFHGGANASRSSVPNFTILKNRVRSFIENANSSRNIAVNGDVNGSLTNWDGGSAFIALDTAVKASGTASVRNDAPAPNNAVKFYSPGSQGTYSAIVSVLAPVGVDILIHGSDSANGNYVAVSAVGTGTWQRITIPEWTTTSIQPGVKIRMPSVAATMWIDEVQILTSMDTSARVFRPSRNVIDFARAADQVNPISALVTWVRNLLSREKTEEFVTSIGTKIKIGRSGMVPLADVRKYADRFLFVTGDAEPKTVSNKAPNPGADVDVSIWTPGNMSLLRTTSNQKSGSGGFAFISISAVNHNIRHVNNRQPVEEGKMYWGAAEYRTDGNIDGRVAKVYLDFYDASSTRTGIIPGALYPVTYPNWTRAVVVGQAPPNSVTGQIIVEVISPTTGVFTTYVDEIIWDEGDEVREYKSGDSGGWTWDGVANLSTSHGDYYTWIGNVRETDKTDTIWVDGTQRRIGESFPLKPETLAELRLLRVMEDVYPTLSNTNNTIYA